MVCVGIRNMRTTMPAKHDGPISIHSRPTTAAAWRGPTHRKCRKMVTCWRELSWMLNELQHDQKSKKKTEQNYFRHIWATQWSLRSKFVLNKCVYSSPNGQYWAVFTRRADWLDSYFLKTLIQTSMIAWHGLINSPLPRNKMPSRNCGVLTAGSDPLIKTKLNTNWVWCHKGSEHNQAWTSC